MVLSYGEEGCFHTLSLVMGIKCMWENIAGLHLVCVCAGICVHMLFPKTVWSILLWCKVKCLNVRKCQEWDNNLCNRSYVSLCIYVQYSLHYAVTWKFFPLNVCIIECTEQTVHSEWRTIRYFVSVHRPYLCQSFQPLIWSNNIHLVSSHFHCNCIWGLWEILTTLCTIQPKEMLIWFLFYRSELGVFFLLLNLSFLNLSKNIT